MAVTRREVLKFIPAALLGIAAGSSLQAGSVVEPEEEWRISTTSAPNRALIIRVFPSGNITVCKGSEVLWRFRDTKGWWTFRGKHGTCIKLRHIGPRQLDIDHFMIVKPDGERGYVLLDHFMNVEPE